MCNLCPRSIHPSRERGLDLPSAARNRDHKKASIEYCPYSGWLLQWLEAHCEARKPVTRAVGQWASDDFEASAFEEGLGAEEDVVGACALVSGSWVGLYDRSAVLKRILCCRPNEGYGHPLATSISVDGHARDNPDILIVHPGCSPGLLDAGKLAPGSDGNPAYGVFSLEGEEPRGVRASGQIFHSSAAVLRAGPLAGEHLPLGASDPGEHAPASAAPASPEDDPHTVQQAWGQGSNVQSGCPGVSHKPVTP